MRKQLIFLLLFSINIQLTANEINNDDEIIQNGLDYLYNMEFQKAEELFDQLIIANPDDPEGYFFKSSIYFWIANLDPAQEENGKKFKELTDQTIKIAKKKLRNNPNDVNALFYLGGAYGNLGWYYEMNNSMIKAYWNGRRGKNYLDDVVKKDRTYYDAYLGLGIYHYYVDMIPDLAKNLSKIIGIDGDKKRGLMELEIAINKSKFAQTEAMFFLGLIKRQFENKPIESEEIFRQLVENYPNNIFFLSQLANNYLVNKKLIDAIKTWDEIVVNKNSKPYPDLIKNVTLAIFYSNFRLNKFDKAIECYLNIEVMVDEKDISMPQYNQLILDIGFCHEILGRREKALSFYKMIRKENNESIFKQAQRSIAEPLSAVVIDERIASNYRFQNKPDSAIYIYESAITKMNSGQIGYNVERRNSICYNMGICYKELQEFEKARFCFNEVLKSEDKTFQKEAKAALNELGEMTN